MATVTSFNEINLNEYLDKNFVVILCTIYGIHCLIFNQYSINNLNNMNIYYPGNEKYIGIYIHDLYYCQEYTLLYLLIIKYSKEIVGPSALSLENIRLTSLLLLEFIKVIYISYQMYNNNIKFFGVENVDEQGKYYTAYFILMFTYTMKVFTIWSVILCFVILAVFILISIIFQSIKELFKSIKIREPVDLELEEGRPLKE